MQEQNKETYLLGSVSFMIESENQPFLQLTQIPNIWPLEK